MTNANWKDEAKKLKKQLKKAIATLESRASDAGDTAGNIASKAADMATAAYGAAVAVAAKPAKVVSPLAPEGGFPALPEIRGVEFAAVEAGVRYRNRKDVMLVRLAADTAVAGVFTRSSTRAACVLDCQEKLALKVPAGAGAAIIVNSGNANAFTGALGQASVDEVTGGVAQALGIPASRVFSSSTGVIGEPLPHDRIVAKLPDLVAGLQGSAIDMAAQAIITTDTFAKGASAVIEGDGGPPCCKKCCRAMSMIHSTPLLSTATPRPLTRFCFAPPAKATLPPSKALLPKRSRPP